MRVEVSNHSKACSSDLNDSSFNRMSNHGDAEFVSILCKDDDNNSSACKAVPSKINSVRLSPLLLDFVTSALRGKQ